MSIGPYTRGFLLQALLRKIDVITGFEDLDQEDLKKLLENQYGDPVDRLDVKHWEQFCEHVVQAYEHYKDEPAKRHRLIEQLHSIGCQFK